MKSFTQLLSEAKVYTAPNGDEAVADKKASGGFWVAVNNKHDYFFETQEELDKWIEELDFTFTAIEWEL